MKTVLTMVMTGRLAIALVAAQSHSAATGIKRACGWKLARRSTPTRRTPRNALRRASERVVPPARHPLGPIESVTTTPADSSSHFRSAHRVASCVHGRRLRAVKGGTSICFLEVQVMQAPQAQAPLLRRRNTRVSRARRPRQGAVFTTFHVRTPTLGPSETLIPDHPGAKS